MRCSQLLLIAFVNTVVLTGCVPIADPPNVGIAVVDVEGAEPPEVGPPVAYKLRAKEAIGSFDPLLGHAAQVIVTVTTHTPESIRIHLLDTETGRRTPFQRLSSNAEPSARRYATDNLEYESKVRSLLLTGHGIYWAGANGSGEPTNVHRLHIFIPTARITPFMQLELSSPPGDTNPTGAAAIELVQDFLYMAVIGDSVLWGNGLEEKDKMTTHVVTTLERETGRRVIVQRFAQNGATLIPTPEDEICTTDCNGEAPTTHTSIATQAALIERGELIELVLMNGCINDVSPARILNPIMDENVLAHLTDFVCGEMMVELLNKVRSVTPRATVIVAGYYPVVSVQSDLFGLQEWLDRRNIFEIGATRYLLDGLLMRGMTELLAQRSLLFNETARSALTWAVETVNRWTPGSHWASFVDPGFGPDNAVFAPDSWLWSMSEPVGHSDERFPTLDVALEDPLSDRRTLACFNANVVVDPLACFFASVGHPNPRGARAYADAIIAELREVGMLPSKPPEQDQTSPIND